MAAAVMGAVAGFTVAADFMAAAAAVIVAAAFQHAAPAVNRTPRSAPQRHARANSIEAMRSVM